MNEPAGTTERRGRGPVLLLLLLLALLAMLVSLGLVITLILL